MNFSHQLNARLLGGEVLARIGRERLSGRLTWEAQSTRVLVFSNGRAEQVDGKRDKTLVVGALRAAAIDTSGQLAFEEDNPTTGASLGIDTLGEVLVAMMRGLSAQQIEELWASRAGDPVEATPLFDRYAPAVSQLAKEMLQKPKLGARLGDLPSGGGRAGWLALIVLGALRTTPVGGSKPAPGPAAPAKAPAASTPTPAASDPDPPALELPSDPAARELVLEIEKAYRAVPKQNYYELLGVGPKASAEDVRKAYFEVAKRWHSDRFRSANLGEAALQRAEEIFRAVGDAQRVLTDAEQRKSYDFVQDRKAKGLPTEVGVILEAEGTFRKAQTLVRRGQAAAAEPLLRKAVQMNPGEAEFWAYLGFAIYAAKGKPGYDEARQALNRAIEMNAKLDAPHEFLGRIARIEGQTQEAQRHLKRALELNGKNVEAERELRLLAMRSSKTESTKGGLFGFFKK